MKHISQRQILSLIASAFIFFALDQAAKLWIQANMTPMQSISVWPEIFQITYVHNTGAAFSLFEQYPSLLLGVTLVLFLVILGVAILRSSMSRLEMLGFSMVLGGALGNITDRLAYGKVVDFLDVVCIHYPVFNLADSFIFLGVCVLLLLQFFPSLGQSRA